MASPSPHLNGHSPDPAGGRTPSGWPVTSRPLRIAILGWARLSAQAWEGSGYNLSASELARGLVMSGHSVAYLQAGMTYRLRKRSPHIVLRERWGGVECFDLRNSPNLSPAASNFINRPTEMGSPPETALVLERDPHPAVVGDLLDRRSERPARAGAAEISVELFRRARGDREKSEGHREREAGGRVPSHHFRHPLETRGTAGGSILERLQCTG